MAVAVIAGLFLLAAVLAFLIWLRDAEPARVAQLLRRGGFWLLVGGGGALFFYLLMTGKMFAALGALFALAPLLLRGRDIWRRVKAARGPTSGQASDIETATLRMRLDHDSGAVDGEVIAGRFAGAPLSGLSRADFETLLDDCDRDDPPSAKLLRAWAARARPDWV
ncbi:MAG: hypothetical protein AAF684_10030, partial [Pseudomonadota bacterium]